MGEAKFVDRDTILVNGKEIKFLRACICTGGKPAIPLTTTPGLASVPFYTSENIFNITEQPPKVLIIGGGPIGSELGQAFQRLGSKVTLTSRNVRLLPKDDREAAKILED